MKLHELAQEYRLEASILHKRLLQLQKDKKISPRKEPFHQEDRLNLLWQEYYQLLSTAAYLDQYYCKGAPPYEKSTQS